MKAYHCYMKDDPDAGECIVFADNTSGAKKLTKTMKFHPYKCGRDPILTGYKVSQYPDWIDIEMQDGKTVRYKR